MTEETVEREFWETIIQPISGLQSLRKIKVDHEQAEKDRP
jgi:hypothetical protein